MADFIREIFAANRVIILFVYGQVFFVLGLVIALQSWQHSRLALARHLKWLALFGFTHGLHEWGDVFIPLQAQYLGESLIELLLVLQAMLLAISFACLFQFGVENLRPLPDKQAWLRYLPGAALEITATSAPVCRAAMAARSPAAPLPTTNTSKDRCSTSFSLTLNGF